MVGITSYGAYIPFNRLQRIVLSEAFGEYSGSGEKAVANHDEDSVSMATEACYDCLNGVPKGEVDMLYFATTTAPYREKLSAAIIAAALDLKEDARTADFTDTLRAGSTAMLAAMDAVKAGANMTLVCVSDCRLGAAQGQFEQLFGDGAAAFTFGANNPLAEFVAGHSVSMDFTGHWRAADDTFERGWEERFVVTEGYNKMVAKAVKGVLDKAGVTPEKIAKIILYGPTPRYQTALASSLGFTKGQIQDSMYATMGNAGSANAPIMLAAALGEARPDDLLLFATFGEGSDAILFKATKAIGSVKPLRGVAGYIGSKKNTMNYPTYLKWRNLIGMEQARRPEKKINVPAIWRGRRKIFSFCGTRCIECGTPQYPPQRVCAICRAKDRMEEYSFIGKKAVVATFTADFLASSADPPTVFVVVDFLGGGRIFAEATDCEVDKIEIGSEIELTFRRLYEANGVRNYYWKVRPKR